MSNFEEGKSGARWTSIFEKDKSEEQGYQLDIVFESGESHGYSKYVLTEKGEDEILLLLERWEAIPISEYRIAKLELSALTFIQETSPTYPILVSNFKWGRSIRRGQLRALINSLLIRGLIVGPRVE